MRQIRSSYDVLRCVFFLIGYTPFENYNWELVSSSSETGFSSSSLHYGLSSDAPKSIVQPPAPKTSGALQLTFEDRNYFEETNGAYCQFLKKFCRKCFCVLVGNDVAPQQKQSMQEFLSALKAGDLGAEQSGFGHQPGRQMGLVAGIRGRVVSWSEVVEDAIRKGQLEASDAAAFKALKAAHGVRLSKARSSWKVWAEHEEHGEEVAKFIRDRGGVFGGTLLAWPR